MFRSWEYWLLFFSSYAPLFAMLAIRTYERVWLSSLFAGIGLLAAFGLFAFLRLSSKRTPDRIRVVSADSRPADATAYIASYIIPLFPSGSPGANQLLALSVLLAVLGAIYVQSALVYVNPMLHVFGWRTFDILESSGRRSVLIAREAPASGSEIDVNKFAPGVLIWST
ncbi:hypothetical protein [Candidatus Amarobacter glycogenicus]|uniref:hypothetical protein n=1 Tax=Candidatus Amarobacter glycogenicus TaxID=3140699 RepID=UPI002A12523F|nr:hypothetical protein [Dehalococcoidia bacterium]